MVNTMPVIITAKLPPNKRQDKPEPTKPEIVSDDGEHMEMLLDVFAKKLAEMFREGIGR